MKFEIPLDPISKFKLDVKSVIPDAVVGDFGIRIPIKKRWMGIIPYTDWEYIAVRHDFLSGKQIWEVWDEEVGIKLKSIGLQCELHLRIFD